MFPSNGTYSSGSGEAHRRYPASPQGHGMLMSESGGNKKACARWAGAERQVSLAELALGLLVFMLSSFYLHHLTERTGQILGGLLILSGSAGWVGGWRRNPNFVNAQIIASIVGALLAFQLMGEVMQDRQVDCALAELHHRSRSLEKKVDAARHAEALTSVYTRLNEMEDMLTLVQHGAAKHMELRQEQQKLKDIDLTYIRAKLDMVKGHAEQLAHSVLKNPNVTAERINTMSEEEKNFLRLRLDTADRVVERIQKHHTDPSQEISVEEYEALLEALTHPSVAPENADHPELKQAKGELPNFKAAHERQKGDVYHTLAVGDAHHEIQKLDSHRQQRREEWNAEFERQLAAYSAGHGGDNYLYQLPEHCVKETTAEKMVVWVGVASMLLQLVAAYVALSLSVRLPGKRE